MNRLVKLKEIATVITGHPFKGELYSDSGIRTVRGENVTEGALRWDTIKCWNQKFEKENYYMLRSNDVVIGMDGSKVGKNKARIKKEDLPLLLAQRVACVRTNDDNDQRFLYYLINNPRFELYVLKMQTGSSVPHISKEQIENFAVPKVELIQQRQIAAILSALDDKIELNSRINAELEQMAKTLYDYWFVQFDFPNEEGKPYKASGGKMEYNEVLKKELPERWVNSEIGNIADLIRGVSYNKEQLRDSIGDEDIKILRATNISGNSIDLNDPVIVPRNIVAKKQILNNYDILLTMSSGSIEHIGKNGFFYYDEEVSFGAFCAKLVPSELFRYYLYLFMQSPYLKMIIKNECLGTNINNLNSSMVKGFKIVEPDRETLRKFNVLVKPLFEKIQINTKQNRQLSSLRDWILPMLMNGQVSVGNTYATRELSTEPIQMAAEPVAEYGRTVKLTIPDKNKAFAKQVLGGKIVSLFKDDPNFTHIKFQKLQYLAEHIAEADLDLNYYFQTAGPHDGRFMHTIADKLRNSKWFEEQNYKFYPLGKQDQIDGYYQGYFAPAQDRLDKLFRLLANANEADAEIFATLYAVWNNRIILKQPISEPDIIEDFYKWSDRKLQYSKDQLLKSLEVLRNNQMAPTGFGKEIKTAKNKSK